MTTPMQFQELVAPVARFAQGRVLDAALRRLEEAGVTTFMASPFPVDAGAGERTVEYLAGWNGRARSR